MGGSGADPPQRAEGPDPMEWGHPGLRSRPFGVKRSGTRTSPERSAGPRPKAGPRLAKPATAGRIRELSLAVLDLCMAVNTRR